MLTASENAEKPYTDHQMQPQKRLHFSYCTYIFIICISAKIIAGERQAINDALGKLT